MTAIPVGARALRIAGKIVNVMVHRFPVTWSDMAGRPKIRRLAVYW